MKKLILAVFLVSAFSVNASQRKAGCPVYLSPGPGPLQLNITERLWLFCRVFSTGKQNLLESCEQLRAGRQPASRIKKDSLTDLAALIVHDFILYDSAGVENLTLQKKADIINSVIGWPGFVVVDSARHFVWFDYTVPHKAYGKKKMEELSKRYAAIAYSWLLRNENIKRWTMMVHFSKQTKKGFRPLSNLVYSYVGEVYFHSIPDPTFDEVLAGQLRECASF